MVIGNRIVGGIAAVGLAKKNLLVRRNIQEGDKIITHNIWGNTVIYKELEDGNYEVLNYSD